MIVFVACAFFTCGLIIGFCVGMTFYARRWL